MKNKIIIFLIITNIISILLLTYTLTTDYTITTCTNEQCITHKQKIFNYIMGAE